MERCSWSNRINTITPNRRILVLKEDAVGTPFSLRIWRGKIKVSQQALSQRFLTLPAILFERIFTEILPALKTRWSTRHNRPLPESVQYTLSRFENIWCADGSTLEALFRKLKI